MNVEIYTKVSREKKSTRYDSSETYWTKWTLRNLPLHSKTMLMEHATIRIFLSNAVPCTCWALWLASRRLVCCGWIVHSSHNSFCTWNAYTLHRRTLTTCTLAAHQDKRTCVCGSKRNNLSAESPQPISYIMQTGMYFSRHIANVFMVAKMVAIGMAKTTLHPSTHIG